MQNNKTLVLNSLQITQKINRLAHQVFEDNYEEQELIIVGIAKSGYILAQRLAAVLGKISDINIKLVELSMDKENPGHTPTVLNPANIAFDNRVIILVDDVINSARTLIYALQPFHNIITKKMRTVVLVDRNHKRFPIAADFVGLSLSTTMQEHIEVDLSEGTEAVYLS